MSSEPMEKESKQINKKLLLERTSPHVKILKKNSDDKLSNTIF
jgi:hypothetical protein